MALPGFRREGPRVVQRDENDRLVKDERGKPVAATLPTPAQLKFKTPKQKKETWRSFMGKLSKADGVEGGQLIVNMMNLANGTPQVPKLPDGREGEPVIITPEVQRAANMDLLQMLVGKSVAQSEVSKAMEDERSRAQFEAMSEAQLDALIEGEVTSVELLESGEE